jgi:tetratricopeptide (TPR) repeat protein
MRLPCYDKAIEIDPSNSFNYLQRACFRHNNSQENASTLSDYNKAIQISPSISFLYAYRAEFKDKIGDKKGAINDLRKESSLKEMEK